MGFGGFTRTGKGSLNVGCLGIGGILGMEVQEISVTPEFGDIVDVKKFDFLSRDFGTKLSRRFMSCYLKKICVKESEWERARGGKGYWVGGKEGRWTKAICEESSEDGRSVVARGTWAYPQDRSGR